MFDVANISQISDFDKWRYCLHPTLVQVDEYGRSLNPDIFDVTAFRDTLLKEGERQLAMLHESVRPEYHYIVEEVEKCLMADEPLLHSAFVANYCLDYDPDPGGEPPYPALFSLTRAKNNRLGLPGGRWCPENDIAVTRALANIKCVLRESDEETGEIVDPKDLVHISSFFRAPFVRTQHGKSFLYWPGCTHWYGRKVEKEKFGRLLRDAVCHPNFFKESSGASYLSLEVNHHANGVYTDRGLFPQLEDNAWPHSGANHYRMFVEKCLVEEHGLYSQDFLTEVVDSLYPHLVQPERHHAIVHQGAAAVLNH